MPVSLTEAALSCLRSIHHGGELADFMSAALQAEAGVMMEDAAHAGGRCEDGSQRVFRLFNSGPNPFLIGVKSLFWKLWKFCKYPVVPKMNHIGARFRNNQSHTFTGFRRLIRDILRSNILLRDVETWLEEEIRSSDLQ